MNSLNKSYQTATWHFISANLLLILDRKSNQCFGRKPSIKSYQNLMNNFGFQFGVLLFFTVFLIQVNVNAQNDSSLNGSIYGLVIDAHTGDPLADTEVRIVERNFSVSTDNFGRFFVSKIQPGTVTIQFISVGYEQFETSLEVLPNDNDMGKVEMSLMNRKGDLVFSQTGDRQDAQVYSHQIQTNTISYINTRSDMFNSGDYSLQHGLTRLPGVQMSRDREINLRGIGRDKYVVSMDGQMVPSSNPSGRSVNLFEFSSDMFSSTEIIWVRTPDMEAEGISGLVNLNSWDQIGNRELSLVAAGMTSSGYSIISGMGQLANVRYSERFTDQFALDFKLNYQNEVRGYESLNINYGTADFNGNTSEVIEQVSPGLNNNTDRRLAGILRITYEQDLKTSFFIRSYLSDNNFLFERHQNISSANGDWIDPSTTGLQGRRGAFSYNPTYNRNRSNHFLVNVGGRHRLSFLTIKYSAGWAKSLVDQNHYDFFFNQNNLNFDATLDNRLYPSLTPNNVNLQDDGTLDQRTINFATTERIRNEHDEIRYTSRLDFELPVGKIGLIKSGLSGTWLQKNRSYEEANLSTLRTYSLLQFNKIPRSSFSVLDRYYFPTFANAKDIANYVDTSRPDMRQDESNTNRRSLPANYFATEELYAAYGMINMKWRILQIQTGLRIESLNAEYDGKKLLFNRFGSFDSQRDTTNSNRYLDLFPNLQLTFKSDLVGQFKLAYSKSIIRPDFEFLAPFEVVTPADTTILSGNTQLNPIISDNFDLMYSRQLNRTGLIKVGAFYKVFSDNIYLDTELEALSEFPLLPINDGEEVEARRIQYKNSDEITTVYGFEILWDQSFRHISGFFGNFGLNANYSWTQSRSGTVRNGEDIPLQFQSPHVINLGINYDYARIMGKVNWHWTSKSLFLAATEKNFFPLISQSDSVYMDLYEDGWMDLSAQFGLRLSPQFRFWLEVSNLLQSDKILYGEDRALYPYGRFSQNGYQIMAGLKFTL